MGIRDQRHTNISKHTFLDGADVGPPKYCVYGRGLNQSIPEGINLMLSLMSTVNSKKV